MLNADDLKKELRLVAENDGDSYRAGDPTMAIHKAFHDYLKRNSEHLWETFFEVHGELTQELKARWEKTWTQSDTSD